ncbi:hypothetical protein B0H10DRAFT_1938013 [Mycena sp. CBHHK59/15]|nr:hypothetical protein B0H10DRAFT_1938013 [Mycena sp. CBHHK59/15]
MAGENPSPKSATELPDGDEPWHRVQGSQKVRFACSSILAAQILTPQQNDQRAPSTLSCRHEHDPPIIVSDETLIVTPSVETRFASTMAFNKTARSLIFSNLTGSRARRVEACLAAACAYSAAWPSRSKLVGLGGVEEVSPVGRSNNWTAARDTAAAEGKGVGSRAQDIATDTSRGRRGILGVADIQVENAGPE